MTSKWQVLLLPEASVAVALTVVTPGGKWDPEAGLLTTVTGSPELSVTGGSGHVTVVFSPRRDANTPWSMSSQLCRKAGGSRSVQNQKEPSIIYAHIGYKSTES